MATTTAAPSPARLDSIRKVLAIRKSALAGLALASDRNRIGSQWAADRVRELVWSNATIEATADRMDITPAELIRLAGEQDDDAPFV